MVYDNAKKACRGVKFMTIGALGLKFLNFILGLLPDVDLTGIPVIENITDLMNIFAWANFFLPSGVIFSLLAITGTYYIFRSIYVILRDFIF